MCEDKAIDGAEHDTCDDTTSSGHPRTTCNMCGRQLVRQPWMSDDVWASKHAEFHKAHAPRGAVKPAVVAIEPTEVIPPGREPKKVLVVDDTGDKPRAVGFAGKPLQTEWELKNRDFALATALISGMMGWGGGLEALAYAGKRHYTPTEKKPTRCGLPGCDKLSKRDYCCPEHCRQHKALQKAKRNNA